MIERLSLMGFTFTLVPHRKKGPRYKGWQTDPKSAQEAQQHLARGGSVGVHCGPLTGILCVDVDGGLETVLAKTPALANTLQCYRANASDRRKFFFRIAGELPLATSFDDGAIDIDLLSITKSGTSKNATILGTHESGAAYQLTSEPVQTITREQFDRMWEAWTGERPQKPAERPSKTRNDPRDPDNWIEEVKAYWTAWRVFEHFGYTGEAERAGDRWDLHGGHGGLYVDDPGGRHPWRWHCFGADAGGDQIDAWHWCRHGRILDRNDSQAFIETVKEMADGAGIAHEQPWPQGPDPKDVRAAVPALRAWVKTTSFTEHVPQALQASTGYRTDSTDTKIADALLDIAESKGTWTFYVNLRALAWAAGLGSHNTAAAALARLEGWFSKDNGDGTFTVVHRLTKEYRKSLSNSLVNLCATYSEQRNAPAFLSGRSKAAKLLENDEPGLGETILRLIDAIEQHGAVTRVQLMEITGKTKSAVGRATRRAEQLAIFEVEQEDAFSPKVYSLSPRLWQRIAELTPRLKTFLLDVERHKRFLEEEKNYCEWKLGADRAGVSELADDERQRLRRKRARVEAALADVLPVLYPWMEQADVDRWLSTPNGPNAAFGPPKAVRDENRIKAYQHSMARLSALVQPGRLLRPHELAEARHHAGRLGVNLGDYVDCGEGYTWGKAQSAATILDHLTLADVEPLAF